MIPGDTTEQRRSTGWDFLRRPGMTYALVLALVAVTFLARSLVAPTLGSQSLYLFLMPAVLIAGIVGGLGPGLLATFLCLVLHLYATGEYSNLANVGFSAFCDGVVPSRHVRDFGNWYRLGWRAAPEIPNSCG